jgi:hypothetical protein
MFVVLSSESITVMINCPNHVKGVFPRTVYLHNYSTLSVYTFLRIFVQQHNNIVYYPSRTPSAG